MSTLMAECLGRRWGNGFLALLFILALGLFSAWRWHPETWLRAEIDGLASRAGADLQYRDLHLSGLRLEMDAVKAALPGLPAPIRLDRLSIMPSLLSWHPGVRVSVRWHGRGFHFSVSVHGPVAMIHIPDTQLPLSVLRPWWQQRLPLNLGGDLELHGDVGLALADGRPMRGKVMLTWRHASAAMAKKHVVLGHYRMQGRGREGRWRFGASGGTQARLELKGRLDAAGSGPGAWRLQAQGRLSARPGSAVAGMMEGWPVRFSLSGSVAAPRLQLR